MPGRSLDRRRGSSTADIPRRFTDAGGSSSGLVDELDAGCLSRQAYFAPRLMATAHGAVMSLQRFIVGIDPSLKSVIQSGLCGLDREANRMGFGRGRLVTATKRVP